MILYRFTHKKYATDLSGTGAKLMGGRWNPAGSPVIYTSESISLALLEVMANAFTLKDLKALYLMEIEIPAATKQQHIRAQSLKKDWILDFEYTQWMGQEILKSGSCMAFRCPSAIIQQEHNYLLNPEHPEFSKVKLVNSSGFYFDERLFRH